MAHRFVRTLCAKALSSLTGVALVASMLMVPGIAQTGGDVPAATPAAPTGGDLSHLVYTARSGLSVRAISPDDGGIVNSPATSIEVATVAGAGVEIAVDSNVVSVKHLGRRAELEDGSLRYTYYGIVLAPGLNHVTLTPLGADGLRGPSVTLKVWGPGPPESIHVTGCSHPRADGRTACPLRFAVLDHWGHPALPGTTLKAAISSGDAAFAASGISGGDVIPQSVSASSLGQSSGGPKTIAVVLAAGSSVTLPVVPGVVPSRLQIAAGVGEVSAGFEVDVMAYARAPFVTGLATVGIGAVPGDPSTDPTAANGTDSRLGRIALFGTGLLAGNAIGTIAYDTAGSLAATPSTGSFEADPDDRPYATYGDASIRRNDALTQDRLYARIDDGYTSAMWGEFLGTTGPVGAAGTVSMQVDGAKVVIGSATASLSAFTAANPVGYGRQLLAPTGLATLDTLAHDNLVIGSETVTLVSLDRRTGVIIRQTTLQDLVDYTIDYPGGIIRFINVPLPFDAEFNPQQILVTYQYASTGGAAKTTGARLDAPLTRFDAIKLGLGYLNDNTGTGDFSLLSQTLTGKLPGGAWSLSHATSDGFVPGTSADALAPAGGGSALRFEGSSSVGPLKLSFGYDAMSAGFDNPFGGLSTPGLTDYHFNVLQGFGGKNGDVSLAYDHEQNIADGAASTESNLAAVLREKFGSRLTLHSGVTFHQSDTAGAPLAGTGVSSPEPDVTPAPISTLSRASVIQADAGADWKATGRVTLSLDRDEDIGGSDPTDPAQTTARIAWDFGGQGRIYAQELLSDSPPRTFGSLADVASATRAFELGYVQKVGANTSIDSSYDVSGTGNATDVTAAIGVKEHFAFSKSVHGDFFVQHGSSAGGGSTSFDVYGLSVGYTDPGGRLKTTASLQDRTGSGGGATWSLGAAGKIFGDWSLIAADEGSHTPGSSTDDARIAVAWRPSLSDRGALLAGYERSAGNADVAGAQSGVASVDGLYRLTRHFELTGRYARKIDGDANYVAGTSLLGLGVREQLGPRYDIGAEGETVVSNASSSGGLRAAAAEFGAMVAATLRAAVGYTFGTTADPTLAEAPTRKGIYATLTTTIDRIFGWGAH